jgi:glutamine amidotransferase-like uncharacterized protein
MTIRVYTGFGSSHAGSHVLIQELRNYQPMDVLPISEHEMKQATEWIDKTRWIVFAGKSVGKFKSAIGEQTFSNLKKAVYEGRIHYMGICAGAAFAMQEIYYHVDDDGRKRWISNTGLGLFNGVAKGPHPFILREAFSGTAKDLRRIGLYCQKTGQILPAIHWGGPELIPYERTKYPDVEVISSLLGSGTPMAIKTRFGKGLVVLSSYHPEITSSNIRAWVQSGSINSAEIQHAQNKCRGIDGQNIRNFLSACAL